MKKLNLLNFHFYARLSYIQSHYFTFARPNAILYVTGEISTLYQVIRLWPFLEHTLEHVKQLKVFKVGNFSVYLDLLLLIFRNWLLLSFNFLFVNLLSSCCIYFFLLLFWIKGIWMTVALGISWFSYVCWADYYSCDVCWFVMSLNLYFGFSGQVRIRKSLWLSWWTKSLKPSVGSTRF